MNITAGYSIRPLISSDQVFLREMLYQSLFVPRGSQPFPRNIMDRPEIAKYARNWGQVHDSGFVAADEWGQPVGAAWMRLFRGAERGYGYVDDDTPEVGMAVLPGHRGQGIGTRLLFQLLASAKGRYDYVSLSVAADNPAVRLYERMGFAVVREAGDSLVMRVQMRGGWHVRRNLTAG